MWGQAALPWQHQPHPCLSQQVCLFFYSHTEVRTEQKCGKVQFYSLLWASAACSQLQTKFRLTQQQPAGPEGLSNQTQSRTAIPAAAEAHPVPDISRRTGRNSHGAKLMKYAQKVESFPSETPTVLVDIAASSQQPQGSSLQSALTVARGTFL